MATMVSPRSDIEEECTGKLAFESAEDAARLILEMGTMIHAGQDAVQSGCGVVASSIVLPYRAVNF